MSSPADELARLARAVEHRPTDGAGADASPLPPVRPTGYRAATRTATYGFLASLPLFVLYEVGMLLANRGPGGIRVGADVWIKNILAAVGLGGWVALGVLVLVAGLAVFVGERNQRPALVPRYFGGIVAESLVYAVVLAFVVGGAVGLLFNGWVLPGAMALQAAGSPPVLLHVALSIGAGLYEELFFRVILVGGLFLLANRFLPDRRRAYVAAAIIGAAIFSAVHYIGPYGDAFTASSFTFRFLFGLALNGVFLVRGFAVAAWTHALYDVLVVTGMFGLFGR
ncbi:MAG TPA: CPBP family glutamic-type intramembrane protease [Rhodothermales bacterium]|nr:CPBP family glutamic-type intramembrane protease [Rhodothermales bacterium]